jgi:hypothetical protein
MAQLHKNHIPFFVKGQAAKELSSPSRNGKPAAKNIRTVILTVFSGRATGQKTGADTKSAPVCILTISDNQGVLNWDG